jgi:hypothetical protein
MSRELWEGVGGPVRMDETNLNGIDPTLDACCRREVRRSLHEKVCDIHNDSPCFLTLVYRLNPIASDRL